MKVKRYIGGNLVPTEHGMVVLWSDYNDLLQENATLRRRIKELEEINQNCIDDGK